MGFGVEKNPHGLLSQLTVQFTPAFAESLLTVAATLAVVLGSMDAGGVKLGVKATEIAGFRPNPAQPTSKAVIAVITKIIANRWNFIWCLHGDEVERCIDRLPGDQSLQIPQQVPCRN